MTTALLWRSKLELDENCSMDRLIQNIQPDSEISGQDSYMKICGENVIN